MATEAVNTTVATIPSQATGRHLGDGTRPLGKSSGMKMPTIPTIGAKVALATTAIGTVNGWHPPHVTALLVEYAVPAVAHPSATPLPQSSQPMRLPGNRVTSTAPTTPNDTTTSATINSVIQSVGLTTWVKTITRALDAARSQTRAARHPVIRRPDSGWDAVIGSDDAGPASGKRYGWVFRSRQIDSAGQRRAHARDSASRYELVASSAGRGSIRSSTCKAVGSEQPDPVAIPEVERRSRRRRG